MARSIYSDHTAVTDVGGSVFFLWGGGEAEACDDFLSHAWATERLEKWCALVYTYHFKASGVAYLLTHLLGAFYCAAVAPLDRSSIGVHYQLTCVAAVAILPMVVQVAVLIYGVPSLPGLGPEPSVFLEISGGGDRPRCLRCRTRALTWWRTFGSRYLR